MKLGLTLCALLGFSVVGCGTSARNFKAAGADAGGQAENNNGAGSGNTAGERGGAGGSGPSQGGDAGAAGAESDAGAAGMAGAPDEPADLCVGKVCDSSPAAECKDASTRTTYASSGTCSAGQCKYAPTNTACVGDTPRCKESGSGSQCVTCLADTDCSNDGICNSVNACVCSARFNGKRCEFQVFRGLGKLQGDAYSTANGISRDGSVVIGTSVVSGGGTYHAFRSVNGGALQFIPNPAGATNCRPVGVDSSANILLSCDGGSFLSSASGVTTPVSAPASGTFADISLDGKVLVGNAGTQAVRRAASINTLLGPLQPNGSSWFAATNGDGSIVVGRHNSSPVDAPIRWTASTGLVALPLPSTWYATAATDVSTDGKVIVGWASGESEILSGQIAVKWSGASLSPTALGPNLVAAAATAVNFDGSVIVGSQSTSGAMLWDGAGAHTVTSLLGSTPDLTSGWTLDQAIGVSDDGKFVVGSGTHGANSEAWVVHLP